MSEEIKALREELAKLRERVAVLEARPVPFYPPLIGTVPFTPIGTPPYVLPTITCSAASLAAREAP